MTGYNLGGAEEALGRTNYIGVAGEGGHIGNPGTDFYQGVYWNRSKIDIREITDGTSNTLLFGEIMGGSDLTCYSWFSMGAYPTAFGLSNNPNWAQFSSYHSGVVEFCLADGSVTGLSKSIDLLTYILLSAIGDGTSTHVP